MNFANTGDLPKKHFTKEDPSQMTNALPGDLCTYEIIETLRNNSRWKYIFFDFPDGAQWHHAVRDLTMKIVAELSRRLARLDSPWHVALDTPDKNRSKFKNLIVFDGQHTILVPLKIAANLIRVGKCPVYLGHAGGPMLLVNALVNELERRFKHVSDKAT